MKSIAKSIFFMLLVVQFACTSEKVDETKLLRDEVIAIHDEVMPLMGELKSLKKEIKIKTDSLIAQDSVVNAEKIHELRNLENQLEDAFEGMFVWMRQYKAPDESVDEKEAKAYLTEQKALVEKVNKDIKEALKAAKQELGKG
jgi:hypothetical protein